MGADASVASPGRSGQRGGARRDRKPVGVWGLGFRVWGLGFRVWGLGLWVSRGLGFLGVSRHSFPCTLFPRKRFQFGEGTFGRARLGGLPRH